MGFRAIFSGAQMFPGKYCGYIFPNALLNQYFWALVVTTSVFFVIVGHAERPAQIAGELDARRFPFLRVERIVARIAPAARPADGFDAQCERERFSAQRMHATEREVFVLLFHAPVFGLRGRNLSRGVLQMFRPSRQ